MVKGQKLFENGKFFLGANWWASHAGTNMWRDWNASVVESDMERLKAAGVDVMRVFPLWNDFQPLRIHRDYSGNFRELRIGEEPLPFTEEGRAGIDPVMSERFGILCDIAEKHDVKLIVGLVTGWMSGRMHTPEAFSGLNLLNDTFVVSWQIKFVKYMVKKFKDRTAIAAWDLGNECNCLSGKISQSDAYVWASAITNAIKAEDKSRPVVSGMHGTFAEENTVWRSRDLGEILDVLCTHPYPIFTPHCDTDPLGEMKSVLHSTAETVMYETTGKIPAFVEEIGTLGPMISSEEVAGDYIRAAAFSAWAHNLRGFVWWCANEQSNLRHTPYDWNSVERELGLFRIDGTEKPVLKSMSEMSRFVDNFKYERLPERIKDAVCVLTRNQDTWAAGYGSFVLAKQAGLDIEFAYCMDEIPEAGAYIMPSMSGDSSIYLHTYLELIERVKRGAVLYMSVDDALLSPFEPVTGMRVITRSKRISADTATVGGEPLLFDSSYKLVMESAGADVLIHADDGTPLISKYSIGKGKVYFCAAPIETRMATESGYASGANAKPYYKIYEMLGIKSREKIAASNDPTVCITEHIVDENKRILAVLNHSKVSRNVNITLQNGYELAEILNVHGETITAQCDGGFSAEVEKNTGFAAVVEKRA